MRFTPLINSLPSSVPFIGPEALERRISRSITARIGANESVFGPSPKAIASMQKAAFESWAYGDPENHDLKLAIATSLRVSPENIACGEGIDGLLGLVVRLFIDPGDPVVTSHGAYPTFNFHVAGFGGNLLTTAYVDDHEDPASLLHLAKSKAVKLVYFANPDNPMGTCHPASTVQNFIDNNPAETMLLLDEAYIEFAPDGTAPPIDTSKKNLLRFRTFSKAHGLAGIRVGYCIGHPEIISAFDKIRNHFGIPRISQVGAIAAIADQDWLAHIKSEVALSRMRIAEIATRNGLKPIPSATNFITIDCGRDGPYAKSIVDGLLAHGIFIRMPGVAPLNRCIRVSCGTAKNLDLLAEVLPKVLANS